MYYEFKINIFAKIKSMEKKKNFKESFCIIKEYPLPNGRIQNVVIVDTFSEVIEFDNEEEAQKLASIFETNSDGGYKYTVKKI